MLNFLDIKAVLAGLSVLAIAWYLKQIFINSGVQSDRLYLFFNHNFKHIRNIGNATNRLEAREIIRNKDVNNLSDDDIIDIVMVLTGQYYNNLDQAKFILRKIFDNEMSEKNASVFSLLKDDVIVLQDDYFKYGEKYEYFLRKSNIKNIIFSLIICIFFLSTLETIFLNTIYHKKVVLFNTVIIFYISLRALYKKIVYSSLVNMADKFKSDMEKVNLWHSKQDLGEKLIEQANNM